jgi:hypothetical protein
MRWLSYCVDGGALSLFDGPRFERPAHIWGPMSSTVFFDFVTSPNTVFELTPVRERLERYALQ